MVADDVRFPNEAGEGVDELEALFRARAWIVIWRAAPDHDSFVPDAARWHITRNRHFVKPSLLEIKRLARSEYGDECDMWDRVYVYGAGGAGHERRESEVEIDPVALAESTYRRWSELAAAVLSTRLAWLAERHPHLTADDYHPLDVPAWMRPGIPLQREQRRALRELAEEMAEEKK